MSSEFTDRDKFNKIRGQLKALHEEMSTLSKKKPGDAVNLFKLKYINQILTEANAILDDNYIPLAGFGTFDEESLPTNSDVVLILSQYIECFHRQWSDQDTLSRIRY